MLKAGISAIFGPSTPSSSAHSMNICDVKEIPYIDVKFDADTSPPVINMHPHPDAVAQIFVDMIKAWNWEGFTIVYESAAWLPKVAELLNLYEPKSHAITVRRINVALDDQNYRPVLRRVKLSGDTNIVLDCSIDTLPELLKQAQQVGLMTDHNQFIITTMDMHTIDLEPYQYSGTNITGIRLVDPENPMMAHITNCMGESEEAKTEEESENYDSEEEAEEITLRVQEALTFDGVLLLAEALKQLNGDQLKPKKLNCNNNEAWENGNSITNFMRNTVVQGLTGDIKFDNQGYRTVFAVDIVELTSAGVAKIGTWNSTDGLSVTRPNDQTGAIQAASLGNKTFIVLTALSAPYGMLRDSSSQLTGNDRFEGFGIDLIHELSLMLGFKYEFKLQEDGKYGNMDNVTKEWNGMIRELQDERADLAITDLTITAERESGADFTMPFMNLGSFDHLRSPISCKDEQLTYFPGISILYRKPTKEPPSTFSFMSPFSTEVWLYVGGAYLSVSFCLFLLGRISPSEWDNPYPCIEEPTELENQFTLRNSLWFTIGALLQQGSEIAPKAPSTRAVAALWWFFTLIMVSSYTANLAAFLTVQSLTSLIKSAEDLKQCGNKDFECPVQFGAKRGGSTYNFFKEAEHETYRNMFTYMSNHPELLSTDNDEGLLWAKTKNYAFLMESSSIEYLVERNCDVTQVGGLLDDKGYGIAMKKGSPYRNALSEGVLRLQEQGILTNLKIKWWKEKKGGGACAATSDDSEALPLEIANVEGVFLLLIIGIAVAVLCNSIEMLFAVLSRSIDNKVPFKEELIAELKFIIKCRGNTKTVRHRKSASITSKRSNESKRSSQS
ncbi:hypothetical protein HA402_015565 [Bradysia odoriphaga]|nr:hypothetical protein HA402_015565 [Bradysia odoriphaga]